MIIAHEGLPGSGKSYEAAINQIIPALEKDRKVFAYIEGLNHQKFAEILNKPIDVIQSLLIQLTKEQVLTIHDHVENDSLVIIDELQDFFPHVGKRQLTPQITEFVTQHRHRGIDIVVMGQSHKDFHVLWKRRIDLLMTFMKRDALGMASSYTWVTYKQQGERFVKIRSGGGKYDSKYFGLYASHVGGVTAIDSYSNDRANILKSAAFRIYLPVFFFGLLYAIYYLYNVFHNGLDNKSGKDVAIVKPVDNSSQSIKIESTPVKLPPAVPAPTPSQNLSDTPTQRDLNSYKNFLDYYFIRYRPRLAVLIKTKKQLYAHIEFYDNHGVYIDTFTIPQVKEFGYRVQVSTLGLILSKDNFQYVVKSWKRDYSNTKRSSSEKMISSISESQK